MLILEEISKEELLVSSKWFWKNKFGKKFSCEDSLKELYNTFFNDNLSNINLFQKYNLLKTYIFETELIGLIIWGKYYYNGDCLIYDYKNIPLTIKNISITLLDNYFGKKEIIKLCKEISVYN